MRGASRTVLLGKGDQSTESGDFRPISIPSVLARLLHKILANRLTKAVPIDRRQRAFMNHDGCVDNTTLCDLVLKYANQRSKEVYMCIMDVSKAFDSVSHGAIFEILKEKNVPLDFVEYLKTYYAKSSMRIVGSGWVSDPIYPSAGVRQRDHLSPFLFNLVSCNLPAGVEFRMDGSIVNVAAYADDLTLFASTKQGLQTLIDSAVHYLQRCGFKFYARESMTLTVRAEPDTDLRGGEQCLCCRGEATALSEAE